MVLNSGLGKGFKLEILLDSGGNFGLGTGFDWEIVLDWGRMGNVLDCFGVKAGFRLEVGLEWGTISDKERFWTWGSFRLEDGFEQEKGLDSGMPETGQPQSYREQEEKKGHERGRSVTCILGGQVHHSLLLLPPHACTQRSCRHQHTAR